MVEIVVAETAGAVPVLAGAGGYNTQEVIELAKDILAAGANGILSVTPYYNKPTPEGVYQHYVALADQVNCPIIVYNVPARTGCNIDPSTLQRLISVPNIVGIKEAAGNLDQICNMCRDAPEGFSILSGDDAFTLALIAMGGVGVISVAANEVPRAMSDLVSSALDRDFASALSIHNHLLPLMQVNFVESNPVPVKNALARMGLIEEKYRLPLVPPETTSRERITEVLEKLGLLDEPYSETSANR